MDSYSALLGLRHVGEALFALSFPILWVRLYKGGSYGISFETQVLHLVTFVSRYIYDLFNVSLYNSALKIYLICVSAGTVTLLLRKYNMNISPRSQGFFMGVFAFSAVLAYVYRYNDTFTEFLWAFSQFVAMFIMVPQYYLMFQQPIYTPPETEDFDMKPLKRKGGVDRWLWTYVVAVESFKLLHIPMWMWRWQHGQFDLVSQLPALVHAHFVFAPFLFLFAYKLWRIQYGGPSTSSDSTSDHFSTDAQEKGVFMLRLETIDEVSECGTPIVAGGMSAALRDMKFPPAPRGEVAV